MGNSNDVWSKLKPITDVAPATAPTPAALPQPSAATALPTGNAEMWNKLTPEGQSAAPDASPWSKLTPIGQAAPVETAGPTSEGLWSKLSPIGVAKENPLTNAEAEYGKTNPENMEDEPWYSKAWDWANSPLWDLHQYGTRAGAGTFERGLETGLEDIASGFTSPLQLGLTIATFGGSAVETAGVGALRSIGVSELAAPIVARGAKALMTAGFSAQMVGGLMTQSPQLLDALKDGDVENATRLATNLVATGVFLTKGLKHGIEDVKAVKSYIAGKGLTITERLKLAEELSGIYEQNKSMGSDNARARQEEIIRQLKAVGVAKDDVTQAGIRHYINSDGNMELLGKMRGIADGTIKARELTPEETKAQDAAAELRSWANESHELFKTKEGKPITLYLSDAAEGTHKLGQTLAAAGEEGDEHFVQVKDPKYFPSEESLKKFIEQHGGEEEAKKVMTDAGNDGLVYKSANGPKFITFENDQYRPVEQFKAAAGTAWNREHVFYATDKKNAEMVKNAGIGPKGATVQYFASPEEALKGATLPDSGSRKDLTVFSVPRGEVEASARETNAAEHGKIQRGAIGPSEVYYPTKEEGQGGHAGGGVASVEELAREGRFVKISRSGALSDQGKVPDFSLKEGEAGYQVKPDGTYELKAGQETPSTKNAVEGYAKEVFPSKKAEPSVARRIEPVPDDMLITSKRHMPSHEMERDTEGKITSRSTPLRPMGAEDLPGDNSRFNKQFSPAEKEKYLAGLDKARNLSQEEIAIAKSLRQLYDTSFQRAYEHGLIRSWVEAYHPQAWASEKNSLWKFMFNKDPEAVTNSALNDLRHNTNAGHFDTNINAAKQRAYSTEFQGIMAGQHFQTDDLAMHVHNHVKAIEHAIAGRQFIDALRSKSLRAQDGRPAAVLAGTSRVMGAETDNPALAISPNAVRPIHISNELIEDMRITNPHTNSSPLEDGLKNGTIKKLPWPVDAEGPEGKTEKVPAYAWSTEGYVSIDHQAMRGWGFSGVDTAGNPAILRGEIMVHPDFEQHVRRTIGVEKSIVRESQTLSGINAVAGEAKGLLLSISPFHIIQEGLRAMLVGINPFDYSHMDINENKLLQLGVKNGMTRDNYRAKDQFSTGYASHSKLISAIPGLNRFQSWMQEFLFEKYIPGLKDRAFLKVFGDLRDANPHLTANETASRAADTINDVFGGQNWRKLGVSASQQDFMRMSALAPDWLISEARMTMRAAGMMDKETGAFARKAMAKQMAAVWLGARVLNMLTSGQMHNEAPFGVASKNDKGEEKVYSIRMLPTDIIHMLSDPRQFAAGRVNPLTIRPLVEGISGRDAMGRRAPWDVQAKDLLRGVVPIAGQNLIKGGDLSTFDQIYKAGGASVYKYRTEAEKLAQQYASDRMPSGPVSEENLKAHQEDIRLEDALRKGEISRGQLTQHVSKRRADEIIRRAPLTPLQARFDRLPLNEGINVWDASTNAEKDQLKSMLWKKRVSYMKQHKPMERAEDPTWRKLQHAYGDLR